VPQGGATDYLQIVTGQVRFIGDASGNGNLTLQMPPTPLTSLTAALVQ
jgi:hypothetical protein